MPLKDNKQNKDDEDSVNYKSRLEKKLYLARESPEPVFDISDCNLKSVPSNVFALCRVLRKEALYLQNNILQNLGSGGSLKELKNLKILNVSANKLSNLPSNINELESLEIFDVSMNRLVGLPDTIGGLLKLEHFNVSHNNLKSLPDSIGNCKNLQVLDLKWNENLKQLPVTLAGLQSLVQLNVDPTIVYPPKEVCKQGLHEIIKFLSKDFKGDAAIIPSTSSGAPTTAPKSDSLQKKIELHEKFKACVNFLTVNPSNQCCYLKSFSVVCQFKEKILNLLLEIHQEKQNERLRVERDLLDQNQKEVELQQKLKDDKKKLLESVKNQQESLDADLMKLQEKKNVDRALLIKLCSDEEKRSGAVVDQILKVKRNLQLQYSKQWENERKAEEELLWSYTSRSREIEKKKILESMEEVMKEEILKVQRVTSDRRLKVVQTLASEVSTQNDSLSSLIKKRNEDRTHLIDSLRQNEELQKSAVASLLEKTDASSWELAKQITIVEEQLAELTRLEISKKKLQSESQITELSKNRIALTELLMNLLDRQTARRNQLVDAIRRMEAMRESVKDSEIFWLNQYDKLLNSKSYEMVQYLSSVNGTLVYELYINGVFHYLPLLKDVLLPEVKEVKEDVLTELGIKSSEDRSKILRAIKSFLRSQERRTIPSAPLLQVPSAPPVNDNWNEKETAAASYLVPDECVICMEARPTVIFVPCGHICCCFKCFKSITLCPLCRKPIEAMHKRVGYVY